MKKGGLTNLFINNYNTGRRYERQKFFKRNKEELKGSAGATIFTLIKVQREGKANSNATKIAKRNILIISSNVNRKNCSLNRFSLLIELTFSS